MANSEEHKSADKLPNEVHMVIAGRKVSLFLSVATLANSEEHKSADKLPNEVHPKASQDLVFAGRKVFLSAATLKKWYPGSLLKDCAAFPVLAMRGDVEMVNFMLSRKDVDILNDVLPHGLVNNRDQAETTAGNKRTALYIAMEYVHWEKSTRHEAIVWRLLREDNVDVNAGVRGYNPLIMAVLARRRDLVSELLRFSSLHVNTIWEGAFSYMRTALIASSMLGWPDIVGLLLSHSEIDTEPKQGMTALEAAKLGERTKASRPGSPPQGDSLDYAEVQKLLKKKKKSED